uniref:TAFH domain-containing protein n=1 Tax=Mola mola TaxID=94237 RepID=A0A3Q3XDB7_MOLML
MDASTISADSSTGHDPGETLVVSSGGTSLPGQPGKSGSYPAQTFNGSQTMNFHSGGGAAPAEGSTVASGAGSSGSTAVSVRAVNIGPEMSKGLAGAVMPPSTNSVIQTPLMNSQNAVGASQPASKTVGATVTLARPPVPTARSGATLNENKNASPAVAAGTCATGVAMQTPLVNNIPQANPVSVSAGSHVIKAEPPTTLIQSAPQPAAVPGVPRLPVTMAPGSGAVRAVTPQVLAPRLPHTSPGQPNFVFLTWVLFCQETIENVKKCKSFLSTLIKLASTGKQSTETAASVRELVKDLLEGKLEAEEFTSRLYKELNSSPQPYLVPFLKRSLPALRQLTPDSAAFVQQSQLAQPVSAPVTSTTPTHSTMVLGSPAPRLTVPVSRPQLQPGGKPGQTSSPQRAVLRPQVTLPTTPMVTLRNPAPGHIVLGQQRVQLKELQPGEDDSLLTTSLCKNVFQVLVSVLLLSRLPKTSRFLILILNNHLVFTHLLHVCRDDDDINDVASMAGVNLSEESANILATNSGLVGAVTHSCRDETFLSCSVLQCRMLEIGRRYGLTDLGTDVVKYVSHAAEQRLQSLLEKVSQMSNYEQSSDVRAQLKFFEQLDQLEKQQKEEQEREILLKAAKSRARQEDPEQLRLKQKAKEMQQQELAQLRHREANLTALAAIGPRKKRRILDSPSSSGSGLCPSLSGGTSSSGSRPTRQRITRVNLRDLLYCLENERFTSRSHFLYKGFLK